MRRSEGMEDELLEELQAICERHGMSAEEFRLGAKVESDDQHLRIQIPRFSGREASRRTHIAQLDDHETKKELLCKMIDVYMAYNSTGGSCHIVLVDGNLEDHHIEFCINYAMGLGDEEGELIARRLLELSLEERRELYDFGWVPA